MGPFSENLKVWAGDPKESLLTSTKGLGWGSKDGSFLPLYVLVLKVWARVSKRVSMY